MSLLGTIVNVLNNYHYFKLTSTVTLNFKEKNISDHKNLSRGNENTDYSKTCYEFFVETLLQSRSFPQTLKVQTLEQGKPALLLVGQVRE